MKPIIFMLLSILALCSSCQQKQTHPVFKKPLYILTKSKEKILLDNQLTSQVRSLLSLNKIDKNIPTVADGAFFVFYLNEKREQKEVHIGGSTWYIIEPTVKEYYINNPNQTKVDYDEVYSKIYYMYDNGNLKGWKLPKIRKKRTKEEEAKEWSRLMKKDDDREKK